MAIDRVLRGHDLFGLLNVDQMKRLSEFSSVKRFAAGEVVFGYNDLATHVHMLVSGAVLLRLPAEHQDFSLIISRLEKGELFGLSPLMDSRRYTAEAECRADSEILLIEGAPFKELLHQNCPAGLSIMNRVAHIYFTRYINVLKSLQGVVDQVSLIR